MPPFENDDLAGLYGLSLDYDDTSTQPRQIPLIGVQVKVRNKKQIYIQ